MALRITTLATQTDRPPSGTEPQQRAIPLTLHFGGSGTIRRAPMSVGVPFPRGAVTNPEQVSLLDHYAQTVPLQRQPLAYWSDGSIRWMLLDFAARFLPPGATRFMLVADAPRAESDATAHDDAGAVCHEVGPLRLDPARRRLRIIDTRPAAELESRAAVVEFCLTTRRGRRVLGKVTNAAWLAHGPVRSTLQLDGRFPGCGGLRFHARVHHFAGTKLVRLEVRLHNPNRARHRGGLWDLGDPGSILFQGFHVDVKFRSPAGPTRVFWTAAPGEPVRSLADGRIEILQQSSGETGGDGANHVDRHGDVPLRTRGYRVLHSEPVKSSLPFSSWSGEPVAPKLLAEGLRASPRLALRDAHGTLSVAVPEFWQQFPKALQCDGRVLRVGLFPLVERELHELQGGEQKTHTVWLSLDNEGDPLAQMMTPIRASLPPEWHTAAQSPPSVSPAELLADSRFDEFLRGALSGELSLAARRESIDEYGWRNYGEVPADHEQEHYSGPGTAVSHYNNQFDMILGGILQLARTGDSRWFELFDPLARHVIDIDLYHTRRDRAAYNGGLFWHTDHYRTAGTGTHRSYSRCNAKPGRMYGGGPGCEHNYTSGLLHYHYLTGNPDAADAVVSLAEWVLAMDDGRRSLLGIVDPGPTGLATATADANYHGPGRGAGNSLNALVDAWLLTRDRRYLTAAERVVRRVAHPDDDVASLDLLNAELRWSYTVFLVALSKWLDVKIETNELDDAYAHGRTSLLHYARWMADHERPYFDRPEELEFPTAAWAAQELRKANVLRLASRHADEPERTKFVQRGNELADRAWSDLDRFDDRHNARCLSILMTEGAREAWFRDTRPPAAPESDSPSPLPPREAFIPQKERFRRSLRSPLGLARIAFRLCNFLSWPRTIRRLVEHL